MVQKKYVAVRPGVPNFFFFSSPLRNIFYAKTLLTKSRDFPARTFMHAPFVVYPSTRAGIVINELTQRQSHP